MMGWLHEALRALRQGLNPAVDEAQAGRLRAAQLAAIVRLTPISVLANVIDGGIVVGVFWNDATRLFLIGWALALLVICWVNIRAWLRSRTQPMPRRTSERAVHSATVNAVILGLVWALAPIALFPGADPAKQILIMTLTVGLITADVYVLSTLPRAAIPHCAVMALGVVGALAVTGEPVHLALAVIIIAYTATVVISAVWHGSMVTQHVLARDKLAQQSQLISLLLRDFEESARDWLWEIDVGGNLQHVPPRLAEVSGRSVEALQGANLLEFLQHTPPGATVAADSLFGLRRHLTERTPFHDLIVRVAAGSEWRWWSLTGKPVFDEAGTFTGYRGVGRDVTATRAAEERILYLARHDALTGLPNRTLFNDSLASALERIKQEEKSLAVICLDLDHFKGINETMGHATGDKLLCTMAQRLTDGVGEQGVVARLSGDEFAVLQIGGHQPQAATELAQRLISAVETPMDIGSAQIMLTTSVGIAIAPRDGDDREALLKHAELALYRAKSDGRGAYRFFEHEMDAVTEARHRLELDLRRALRNDEFRLHFQPLVELGTNRINGFEALLRWQHPERGLLSPAEFIPVAEATGMIIPIGEWVLRRACTEASTWPDHIRVAVNLSPIQFRSPNLVPVVVNALATSGLRPERLELEITESLLLEESELSLATMQRLRALGARFSLDDFGTGFSSLGYLRRFPFDKIKIDKSFVQEMANRECLAIVRTIANLAGNLGMLTIAEGIETQEQLDRLRAEGCNEGQGYLFGKPQPAYEATKLVAQAELRPTRAA